MTERTYKCNFCRNAMLVFGAASSPEPRGVGLIWRDDRTLDMVQCYAAENHLCSQCFEAIRLCNDKREGGEVSR